MRFFSRKKSLEDISKDILKKLKNLSYKDSLQVLSAITSSISKTLTKDNIENQLYFDTALLSMLLLTYSPKEAIIHIGFITKKIVEQYPEILQDTEVIHNGVV